MLIAQISDLHLRPEGVLYQGLVDSNATLRAWSPTSMRAIRSPT